MGPEGSDKLGAFKPDLQNPRGIIRIAEGEIVSQEQDPQSIGKYQLLDCIAESYMSKLYRARVQLGQMNRLVAIKVIHPASVKEEQYRDFFFQEIGITQALEHPNIIKILEYGETDSSPYVVMEYLNGKNLRQVIAATRVGENKAVPLGLSMWVGSETLKALEYAHSFTDSLTGKRQPVIHGDLSPHNLMLTYDGFLKLIDFGIARVMTEDSITVTDTIRGKIGYLAPEQLDGKKPNPSSDLFSFGVVLCELLTGKRLFLGKTDFLSIAMIKDCDAVVHSFLAQNPLPSPELRGMITKLLRSDPKLRYREVREVQKDFDKLMPKTFTPFDSKAVSQFMTGLFTQDLEQEKRRLSYLASRRNSPSSRLGQNVIENSETDAVALPDLEPDMDVLLEKNQVPTPTEVNVVELDKVGHNAAVLREVPLDLPVQPAAPKLITKKRMYISVGLGVLFFTWSALLSFYDSQFLKVNIEIDPPDLTGTLFVLDGKAISLSESNPVIELEIGKVYRLEAFRRGYQRYQRMIKMEKPTHKYPKEDTISIILNPRTPTAPTAVPSAAAQLASPVSSLATPEAKP